MRSRIVAFEDSNSRSNGGFRGSKVPWNPPFGFSDDRRLWKAGL